MGQRGYREAHVTPAERFDAIPVLFAVLLLAISATWWIPIAVVASKLFKKKKEKK